MLSFITVAALALCVTITSGACPYVANYYFSHGSDVFYDSGSASMIGVCAAQSNTVNGVDYASRQFICINNEPYMGYYTGDTCQGNPGETDQIYSISDYRDERALLDYSCEDTGCTNTAQIMVSQLSYSAFLAGAQTGNFPACSDPGVDDFIPWQNQPPSLTGLCVDSTGDSSQPLSSVKFTCDSSGFKETEYSGTRDCSGGTESVAQSMDVGEGCIIQAGPAAIWSKVVCGDYPSESPSAIPSLSPSESPSETPTVSTSDPSESPSAMPSLSPSESPSETQSAEPTASPSDAPSISTANPSAAPSALVIEQTLVSHGVSLMAWKNVWVVSVVMVVTNMVW